MTIAILLLLCRIEIPIPADVSNLSGWNIAALASSGAVFWLDRDTDTLYLHRNGETRVIARKGPGPKELDRAIRIDWIDDRLYVTSAYYITIFDAEGAWIKTIRLQNPAGKVVPHPEGYYLKSSPIFPHGNFLRFYPYRDQESPLTLATWPREKGSRDLHDRGEVRRYNPYPDQSMLEHAPQAGVLYLRLPGENTVQVYSLETHERLYDITLDLEPQSVNVEIGEGVVEQLNRVSSSRGTGARYEADLPSHYPLVFRINVDFEGNLLVFFRLGAEQLSMLCFDPRGEERAPVFPQEVVHRVFGRHEDKLGLILDDEEADRQAIYLVSPEEAKNLLR